MASGKRRGSRSGSTGRKKNKTREFPWTSELLMFAFTALAVILFLSNLGLGGLVGGKLSSLFFGLFGIMSYAFPVVIFVLSAFVISNTGAVGKKTAYPGRVAMKAVSIILLFSFLCVFFFLVNAGTDSPAVYEVFSESSSGHSGGGAFGAVIGLPLKKAFGLLCSYILDIIILIICLVLITERSFFIGLRKCGEKISSSLGEGNKKRSESSGGKRESSPDRKTKRSERRVRGVASDTRILPDERKKGYDVSEVIINSALDDTDGENGPKDNSLPGEGSATADEKAVKKGRSSAKNGSGQKSKNVGAAQQKAEAAAAAAAPDMEYIYPDIKLLKKSSSRSSGDSRQHLREMSAKLQNTLNDFGVDARITNVTCGPSVTQYEIEPAAGVKVSRILGLADDIKLSLAVADIRFEAPIPGKSAIGIEVPNRENVTVAFGDLADSPEFKSVSSKIAFCAGKDIAGNIIMADIAKMPHLLIAGATGSGKSVCINTIIMSILYKASPDEVKLIMVDPKVVELSVYNGIPHLLIPVVTDPKKAAGALNWAVSEMMERYHTFEKYGVRDIHGYNKKVDSIMDVPGTDKPQRMPQIVIIVDELADLMMAAASDVEDAICRLAQLARAAGMHLVIATQRPSVNVITGLIKANMPSRIAFAVTSGVDSRTILDMNGAEKLLGKGDMLYYPQNYKKPLRVQGAFVSDKEVSDVVDYIVDKNEKVSYNADVEKKVSISEDSLGTKIQTRTQDNGRDEYFADAGRFVIEKGKGSIGMLQRMFKIGFNRAARIMDQLQEAGVVGEEEGTKPRQILITAEQFEQFLACGSFDEKGEQ